MKIATKHSTPATRAAKRDRAIALAIKSDARHPLRIRWDRIMWLTLACLTLAAIASQVYLMHVMSVTSGL